MPVMPPESDVVRDALQYSGRRCVVAGAGSALGTAISGLLVTLGAEVHALDGDPDAELVGGLASRTAADSADEAQIRAAAARIGAVVDVLFDCNVADDGREFE